MRYFALFYDLVEDYLTRRGPLRAEHLQLADEARQRGELILAGALGDPPRRALLVFRTSDAAAAEEFARNDPYVLNGLVVRWEVLPWTVVVGGESPGDRARPREG